MDAIEKDKLLQRLTKRTGEGTGGERFVSGLLKKYRAGQGADGREAGQVKHAARAIGDDAPKRLDVPTQARMEAMLGVDLSDVRIHTGEAAQQVAEGAGARAFTLNDRDIYFAREEFVPTSTEGRALLAHELTHVAERREGAFPSLRAPSARHDSERSAEHTEALTLALEESSAEVVERVLRTERIEEVIDESMSLDEKKRWLVEQAWRRFIEAERRQVDRLGSF
jgi:hypothetical protein